MTASVPPISDFGRCNARCHPNRTRVSADTARDGRCEHVPRSRWCAEVKGDTRMSNSSVGDAAIAAVRRNTEEVQGKGNWRLFEELFADDFVDHTPQPGTTPDRDGVRVLYKRLRAAFPDFHPEIHWQAAAGNLVTTYKTYHGTHQGEFLGIPATGKKVNFYTVDAMRVVDGKITEHWGVATLLDLMQQLGVVPPLGRQR